MSSVSGDVFAELLVPKIYVGSRRCGRLAPMTVPKAAVHEHHGSVTGENDIRCSGQVFVMEPISQAELMESLS